MRDEPIGELLPPTRLMLTPGPSCIDPRVYRAMATPLVGHLDPWFMDMMGDVQILLRRVFQTDNRVTFPLSASGSGGIEASVLNPLEAGDDCIICVNGVFSERMAVIAERTPANVIRVEAPYGRTVDPEDVRRAAKGKKLKLIGLAHGETSTSVLQRWQTTASWPMNLARCWWWIPWRRSRACLWLSIASALISASADRRRRSARRRECRR